MKNLFIIAFAFLIIPQGASARWIGDWARDYTERINSERISRDDISQTRDARKQERVLRASRSRSVPRTASKETIESPRAVLRTIRLEERLRRRGTQRTVNQESGQENLRVQQSIRNDARRRSDLAKILAAIHSYMVANDNVIPAAIPSVSTEICKRYAASCSGLLTLDEILTSYYIYLLPVDPAVSSTEKGTGYFLYQSEGSIILSAPNADPEITLEWTTD